jgi:RimJ/RimL family protein N-acetyltransferase
MISGRLTRLRPIEPADLRFLKDLANDRQVASHVVGWDFPLSEHGQHKWWESAVSDRRNFRLLIEDMEGTRIGLCGVWKVDWHSRVALTATKLHAPSLKQKGMGTDSIMTLMAWAFYDVGLNRLWGSILDFNGPSFGAYVKHCGWRIEGVLRQEIWRKGRYHDLYRVAILKSEFDQLPDAQEYVDRIVPARTEERVALPEAWWAPGVRGR